MYTTTDNYTSCTIAFSNTTTTTTNTTTTTTNTIITTAPNRINNSINKHGHDLQFANYFRGGRYVPNADYVTDIVHWTLVFVVTPSISVFGIIGNAFNMIIFAKHGFKKSSNILLFSLAISDILFMVGVNGPPKPMYEWGSGGFKQPRTTALVLYYLYHIFDSLNWGSGPASLCIPALITCERLVAVFLPLKFPFIVTPRRTVMAVLVPNILFYGIQVYVRTWFQFAYVFDSSRNVSVGLAVRTEVYWSQKHVSRALEIVINSLIGLVIFVGCGSVAIGVKVKLAALKRRKMTAGQGQKVVKGDHCTSKTTKMLLCLCVLYTIVCSPISLSTIMPDLMVFPVFIENPNFRSVGVFVYHVYKFLFAVNGSVNFAIYVTMSKSYRQTLLALIHRK